MSRRPTASTDWLLLVGFSGFLFFFGLAYFGLVGADEPRYAQVAREMLARHDWITPTLGGSPWLEKPPLYYWQAMCAYRLFGVSDWAARLPSPLDATVMVLAVYFFLFRFGGAAKLDGALMTASAAGVIGFSRAASTDMPLAASFTLALLAWYAWHESGSRAALGIFYASSGLGMLAKGPVAPLLAGVIIVIFALARGDWSLVWRTLVTPMVLLFAAIVVPWYAAVQVRNPDFFRVFILEHNLGRFGSNLYHHKEPFWYYVPVVLAALIPWVAAAIAALGEAMRTWRAEGRQGLQGENALNVFLLIWFVVPVVFFSVSQSKLPGYILPALPAGTLLLADYVHRRAEQGERPGWILIVAHSIVAAAPLVPALLIQSILQRHRLAWGAGAAISSGLAVTLGIGIAVTLRRASWGVLRFVTLAPVVLTVTALLRLGAPTLDASLSARPVAIEISRMERKPLPLAVFHVSRESEFGLAFYRNQRIERYELGQIPSGEHLVVAAAGSQTAVATLVNGRRVSYLGSFAAQGLDYYWVAGKSN